MVTKSWFRNLWTTSKKSDCQVHKSQIAVLAFEAASLITKLLHLWQSLTDKQVARLRDEIANSAGIKKLVSENDDYIGRLICTEMMDNLSHVARAVARLSKKCNDPLLRSFEQAYSDLIKNGADTYRWQFSWKKMECKIKKMERFVAANTSLYQEMETLADLEQTLRRMKGGDNAAESITLVEYEKKVAWKKHEVKQLKENSLWSQTYDYTILLLARTVFTVYGRIGHVFGINQVADSGVREFNNNKVMSIFNSRRGHSTVFMQSSVYPSENYFPRPRFPPGKDISRSGPLVRTNDAAQFNSGPILRNHDGPIDFRSGQLHRSAGPSKTISSLWPFREKSRVPQQKADPLTMGSPIPSQMHDNHSRVVWVSKRNNPSPPDTLGAAALALHYANVVIFIEKLAATPHLIGNDARDELYSMLPASIRSSLRAKLKPHARSLGPSAYDTGLAGEWSEAIGRTLEWLAPLAHNMMRWQSERSFEHQGGRTNVLLVQTLYFASQEKTEAAITELLVGLNYIWRFGREINAGAATAPTFDDYVS
ncbi:Protein of unknown function (DUF668 [Striga hermonthica]|uniref:DUF668 domain-containing protein n=1 Tax=Striga hermonthica TaxID=68872 RepID=A0A9N7RG78_STRHE|nr:Protein of unknown function (DUF668 [Striga hermonthica]